MFKVTRQKCILELGRKYYALTEPWVNMGKCVYQIRAKPWDLQIFNTHSGLYFIHRMNKIKPSDPSDSALPWRTLQEKKSTPHLMVRDRFMWDFKLISHFVFGFIPLCVWKNRHEGQESCSRVNEIYAILNQKYFTANIAKELKITQRNISL